MEIFLLLIFYNFKIRIEYNIVEQLLIGYKYLIQLIKFMF